MKNFKKLIAAATIAGVLGVTGAAYAIGATTPAGIAAGLTGKSVEEITTLKTEGTTYGAIAKDAGKLDEFKAQMLEQKKLILDQRVEKGILTQDQADQIFATMESNLANCDATGKAGIGQKNGLGFGSGMGRGMGQNNGERLGGGMGLGRGVNQQG